MRLQPGASVSDLDACESGLGASLHSSLWNLYRAANGVFDHLAQFFIVWPLAEVVERNRLAWATEGGGRLRWIGFGDDGTGNPFCVPRGDGEDVYYWNPIDHEATRLADTLTLFWEGLAAGSLPAH